MGICLVMIIVVVCGIYFYLSPLYERELLENEKHHTQNLVESTHSLVADYYKRYKNGEFDEKRAQSLALDRLKNMRYDKLGYFWVNDMNARMLMHPIQPKLEGTDMGDYKDANGKRLIMEFVKVCKESGGGFVDYKWPEPGVDVQVDKISYVQLFAPWNWVIGSGVYVDAVKRSLARSRHDLFVGTIALISLLVIINIVIAVRIAAPLNRLSEFSERLQEDLSLRAPPEGSRETRQLARSMNETAEKFAATLVSRDRLDEALKTLTTMQVQILQSEKMASIGQLAAGVAHEINNPMGFINSNLATLKKYVGRQAEFIEHLSQNIIDNTDAENEKRVVDMRNLLKIDHIITDTLCLIEECQEGAERVKVIVENLKNFSRVDHAEVSFVDINQSIDSTIKIAWNEIKYSAKLEREFGDIPQIKCFPQQLNQVFLNLLVNAAHAIQAKGKEEGLITVRTWSDENNVFISVKDTGSGIPEDIRQRIFEPFFTTKEVGKGTGLGLSISYDIIMKHGGGITVESELGQGTTFIIRLPVNGPES